jgi:hypothetical protein
MNSARVSVAPMAFSQAMTVKGASFSERLSMPFAITGAINLRTRGPTEQVTMSAVLTWSMTSCSCVLELMAR